ncbi:MAG: hypothetical protein Q8903_01260 [Bacteroidota bacterium]|nr:hypothetical protein [Bacteroidota bacterium]
MKKIVCICFAFAAVNIFIGCATIEDEVFIQNAQVAGPLNQPPVQVTTKDAQKKFIISSSMVTTNPKSYIDNMSIILSDYNKLAKIDKHNWDKNNFGWSLPAYSAGIQFELPLSKSASVTVGGNYSEVKNKDLLGGLLSFDLHGISGSVGVRYTIGLSYQEFYYDAYTYVIRKKTPYGGKTEESTYAFHDLNTDGLFNYYMMLTINSDIKNPPINAYIAIAFIKQRLLSFTPGTSVGQDVFLNNYISIDSRGSYSTEFISISPGLFYTFNNSIRILCGVTLAFSLSGESDTRLFIAPSFKIDLIL